MRVTVGTIAVLGLAVTVAAAQPPAPRERAATLLPPQAVAPGEMPAVARGAIDDFPPPPALPSTPVVRPTPPGVRLPSAGGPAWLTGSDTNVIPASGIATGTPPKVTAPSDDVPVQPKLLDRLKGTVGGDKQPGAKQPQPRQQPPSTAATPFQGTGTNGAPVFAGPPAYRWYGWGSVTPGANPLAPTGQYPKASANWYSITGATPGAFPVPVGNPARTQNGTEPPSYGLAARTPPAPQPVVPVTPPPQSNWNIDRPDAPRFTPAVGPKFVPNPVTGVSAAPAPVFNPPPAPISVPTPTLPPASKPVAAALPLMPELPVAPQLMPLLPPPSSVAVKETETVPPSAVTYTSPVGILTPPALPPIPLVATPTAPAAEPVKVPVPVLAPAPAAEPVKVAVPVTEPKPPAVVPATLPTSLTTSPPREEMRWQQSAEPATPAPGTWAPAPGTAPLPTVPAGASSGGQTGGVPVTPVVARGQAGDGTPDPVATLIKQVCQGRADGVEVRWTGTKKLSVCFEVHTKVAAQKLVNDLSGRPELTAYQIDFCVLVK